MKNTIQNTLALIIAVVLLATTSGCSLFGPKTQIISVNTSDGQIARVVINGNNHYTPVHYEALRAKSHSVQIIKDGYYDQNYQFDSRLGVLGTLDLIGTILLASGCRLNLSGGLYPG